MEDYKLTTKPNNEEERNVVSSLTSANVSLYENPQPDNEHENNPIGELLEGRFKWKMDIGLSMDCPGETEEDLPGYVKGSLYEDAEYGYYKREYTICSDTYHSTFRFSKGKMRDVLRYILEMSPYNLESFLQTLDGYEWVSQEHS